MKGIRIEQSYEKLATNLFNADKVPSSRDIENFNIENLIQQKARWHARNVRRNFLLKGWTDLWRKKPLKKTQPDWKLLISNHLLSIPHFIHEKLLLQMNSSFKMSDFVKYFNDRIVKLAAKHNIPYSEIHVRSTIVFDIIYWII